MNKLPGRAVSVQTRVRVCVHGVTSGEDGPPPGVCVCMWGLPRGRGCATQGPASGAAVFWEPTEGLGKQTPTSMGAEFGGALA